MEKNRYNIKAVSKITKLTEHTIRAWERRYSAVTPFRTDTNRRLYSDEDLRKLNLLAELINMGHSIGLIANLSIEQLTEMIPEKEFAKTPAQTENYNEDLISQSLNYIHRFDYSNFPKLLQDSSVKLSKPKLLIEFIIPLLERIGEMWEMGSLRVTHEHFAAGVIRTFLGSLFDNNLNPSTSPKLIATTPEGFMHELGALIAALYAMDFGWNAIFLGANLPPEEISNAALENNVDAILLSLVYPNDDPRTGMQLRKLRMYVGNNIPIILSGQSAKAYTPFIEEINGNLVEHLTDLNYLLQSIRESKVLR